MKMNLWLLTATAFAAALTGRQRESSDASPQAAQTESAASQPGLGDDLLPLDALQSKAEGGNASAQVWLGWRYHKGEGVSKDAAKAAEWWKKAAELGDDFAQRNTGLAYSRGQGVSKDPVQAVDWWRRAAEQGNTDSQFYLGQALASGDGAAKNLTQALEWYRKAADKGHVGAQYELGAMYYEGAGVPKDAAKAVEWWHRAAAQGDQDAQHLVGLAYARGQGIGQDKVLAYAWVNLAAAQGLDSAKIKRDEMTLPADQLAEAQRLSSNWKKGQTLVREAANAGNFGVGGAIAKRGTGTAFWVSKAGYAVTNHHVVDGCREIRASGRDGVLKVVTTDAANDIALLQLAETVPQAATISSASPPVRQGDNVVVFGFPLNAVLSSGGNITPGVVSALTGLGNDTNQIQITAPIQPGSSGSPVLNMKGEVVGVTMGKLSDSKVSRATGQVPQNVNFAVNGQTLKTFLDTHNVEYRTSGILTFSKSVADLVDEARKWTLVVECWR